MNSATMKGDWNMLKGKIKEKWGKLTDDDLTVIEGKRDELGGMLQKRYGVMKDEAEKQCREFYDDCGCA